MTSHPRTPAAQPGEPDRFARFNLTPEERALVLGGAGTDSQTGEMARARAGADTPPQTPEPPHDHADADLNPTTGRRARPLQEDGTPFAPATPAPRVDGWTPERQRRFIEALSETGSVADACRTVGMGRSSAYELRRRADGEQFAEAWDAARAQACHALLDTLMDRAMNGQSEQVYDASGSLRGARRRFDNRLGQWLLRHLDPVRFGALADVQIDGVQDSPRRARRRFPAILSGLFRTPAAPEPDTRSPDASPTPAPTPARTPSRVYVPGHTPPPTPPRAPAHTR
ncbi:terminase small subunit-like protein [Pacificimonas sp. ICDLI1SI03]